MAKGTGKKLTITKLRSAVLKKWPSMGKLARSIAASDAEGLRAVYVGKSRRRYMVRPEVVEHPVFQELAEPSNDGGDDAVTVSCEVVLFEHLLWMLENGGADVGSSMDDLVEFYSY